MSNYNYLKIDFYGQFNADTIHKLTYPEPYNPMDSSSQLWLNPITDPRAIRTLFPMAKYGYRVHRDANGTYYSLLTRYERDARQGYVAITVMIGAKYESLINGKAIFNLLNMLKANVLDTDNITVQAVEQCLVASQMPTINAATPPSITPVQNSSQQAFRAYGSNDELYDILQFPEQEEYDQYGEVYLINNFWCNDSVPGVSQITSPIVKRQQVDDYDSNIIQKPKKEGMSCWTKALITLSILMLLGAAIGGGIYYFFYYNKVERLSADKKEVTFSRKGGEKTVTITTDADSFEVTKKPEWVTVTVGDKEITIKCEQLDTYEDREDIIKLKAGDKEDIITVKQNAETTYLRLSQDMIRTGHNGGEAVVNFDTDGDPSAIEYKIDNAIFCNVTKTSRGFTFNIGENNSYSPRQAIITIISDNQEKKITIHQAGKCYKCDGRGNEYCFVCNGSGQEQCPECYGYNQDCDKCGGRGYIPCRYCNRQHPCESCNGTGDNFEPVQQYGRDIQNIYDYDDWEEYTRPI